MNTELPVKGKKSRNRRAYISEFTKYFRRACLIRREGNESFKKWATTSLGLEIRKMCPKNCFRSLWVDGITTCVDKTCQ